MKTAAVATTNPKAPPPHAAGHKLDPQRMLPQRIDGEAFIGEALDGLNLADRVIFTGYQKYPAACMAAMDVVVHTSTSPEPFGLVVLEGMALGKPVVATAHGGPLDVVVEGGTGFLTAPGDAAELAAVLVRLLGDADLRQRVGAAGRARFLDKFTAERNVRQLERVLLAGR